MTAYGNGGFRFADMSHKGSILCLPSGIYAWNAASADELRPEDFDFLLGALEPPITVLLGTGAEPGLAEPRDLRAPSPTPASDLSRCRQVPLLAPTTS